MSNKEYSNYGTAIVSTMHLLVDCLCVCALYLLLYSYVYRDNVVTTILIYNIIAFCTQPLTGVAADRLKNRNILQYVSLVLLTLAVAMVAICPECKLQPLMVAVLLGAGNSFFHVWGGKQTACKSNNNIISIGLFVSTGALGLSLGCIFHSYYLLYSSIMLIAVLSFTYMYIYKKDNTIEEQKTEDGALHHEWQFVVTAIAVLSVIVIIRSFMGEELSSSIVKDYAIILLIGALATCGKIAGGLITKYIGLKRTIIVLVIGIAICYPLRNISIYALFCGIFLINCTMPITLYLANKVLKNNEGLAFGILAASLVPGYLITMSI